MCKDNGKWRLYVIKIVYILILVEQCLKKETCQYQKHGGNDISKCKIYLQNFCVLVGVTKYRNNSKVLGTFNICMHVNKNIRT